MKVQITFQPKLKDDENWQVNLHSFYNIIQVLFIELNILEEILGKSKHLENAIAQIKILKKALRDPQQTFSTLGELDNFKSYIFSEIDRAVMNAGDISTSKLDILENSLINFDRVVKITETRTKEFLNLITHKDEWVNFNIEALEDNLKEFFLTMAMRSKDKYGISFDLKTKQPNDYYIYIEMPEGQEYLSLPALFPDVIRDLSANAKKYSLPGSTISCQLISLQDSIRFIIRDQGRGIPEEELTEVVKFGIRGSNVTKDETFGDGFGLTKAYLITHDQNGKMWIDSVLGEYTEITIEIPSQPYKSQFDY